MSEPPGAAHDRGFEARGIEADGTAQCHAAGPRDEAGDHLRDADPAAGHARARPDHPEPSWELMRSRRQRLRPALEGKKTHAGDRRAEIRRRRRDRRPDDAHARDQQEVEDDRDHNAHAHSGGCHSRHALAVQVGDGDRRDALAGKADQQDAGGQHRRSECDPEQAGDHHERQQRKRDRAGGDAEPGAAHGRARRRRGSPTAARKSRIRNPHDRVGRQPEQFRVFRRHRVDAQRRRPCHQVDDHEVESQVHEQHDVAHLTANRKPPHLGGPARGRCDRQIGRTHAVRDAPHRPPR